MNSIFKVSTITIIILSGALINSCKKDTSATITDLDGNVYHTVTIGTQVWMIENLKTTKYNDGTSILLVTDDKVWSDLITPGYCWYNNDKVNKTTYGALYNWYTVNTNKLCPIGWHVPTDAEWTTLITYFGGEIVSGGKLKETGTAHWNSPNTGTNECGFTALPGGCRFIVFVGTFISIGDYGYWWSSTEHNSIYAWCRYMYFSDSEVGRSHDSKQDGYSVRCVKDN
jgi:uncharacterized protein (TIGR02145 family)